MTMPERDFTRDELESIAGRANKSARRAEDPSMRTALHLLAEAAANVMIKLPARPRTEHSEATEDPDS